MYALKHYFKQIYDIILVTLGNSIQRLKGGKLWGKNCEIMFHNTACEIYFSFHATWEMHA